MSFRNWTENTNCVICEECGAVVPNYIPQKEKHDRWHWDLTMNRKAIISKLNELVSHSDAMNSNFKTLIEYLKGKFDDFPG